MVTALIMAGGESLRMRMTGGYGHKALVQVLGLTMLERNIQSLLFQGFRDLVVVTTPDKEEIETFVLTRGQALAASTNARIRIFREPRPLGTIGVVREFVHTNSTVLVVNVDNLTCLDLTALVHHHEKSDAAMTIATHLEPFQNPFGEVEIKDGLVTAYIEKPVRRFPISSGTYVAGPRVAGHIPSDRKFGIPDLCHTLWEYGETVAAFKHDAPWIDVNDTLEVHKAEALIFHHGLLFECRSQTPDRVVCHLLLRKAGQVVVEAREDSASLAFPAWNLPWEPPPTTASIHAKLNLTPECLSLAFIHGFDHLSTSEDTVIRHHVFEGICHDSKIEALLLSNFGLRSVPEKELTGSSSPLTRRILSVWRSAQVAGNLRFTHAPPPAKDKVGSWNCNTLKRPSDVM